MLQHQGLPSLHHHSSTTNPWGHRDTRVPAMGDQGLAQKGTAAQLTASGSQRASWLTPAPLSGATGWPPVLRHAVPCRAMPCRRAALCQGWLRLSQRDSPVHPAQSSLEGAGVGSCLPLGAPCSHPHWVPSTKHCLWAQ